MGRSTRKPSSPWASIKLRRPLVRWLKIEASKQGIGMGALTEQLVARAIKGTPWTGSERQEKAG
jgi:hypothetical protein